MTRIRFEGLRLPALSAPWWRSPVADVTLHRSEVIRLFRLGGADNACEPWAVILRMLRGAETGGHSPLARLVAVMLIVGLFGLSAPVLVPVFRWVVDLL
jgi:hypothetical protein